MDKEKNMAETKEITVYPYTELPAQGKANALIQYNQPEEYWYEGIKESFEEKGQERGFDIDDVQWSGFGSQGDGASWTGRVNLIPFLTYHLKIEDPDYARYTTLIELIDNDFVDAYVNIYRDSHRYNHEMTMMIEDDRANHGMWDKETMTRGILEGALVIDLTDSIDADDRLLPMLDEWVIDEARRYAKEIYKSFEESYDSYSSEEYFIEICAVNEWRFDAKGNLV